MDEEIKYLKERGINPEEYKIICWPESQNYLGLDTVELINDEEGLDLFGSSAYIVPFYMKSDPDSYEIEQFIINWGQTHSEVCTELNLDEDSAEDVLMGGYFWYDKKETWLPKYSSLYDSREEQIANYLRFKL